MLSVHSIYTHNTHLCCISTATTNGIATKSSVFWRAASLNPSCMTCMRSCAVMLITSTIAVVKRAGPDLCDPVTLRAPKPPTEQDPFPHRRILGTSIERPGKLRPSRVVSARVEFPDFQILASWMERRLGYGRFPT